MCVTGALVRVYAMEMTLMKRELDKIQTPLGQLGSVFRRHESRSRILCLRHRFERLRLISRSGSLKLKERRGSRASSRGDDPSVSLPLFLVSA